MTDEVRDLIPLLCFDSFYDPCVMNAPGTSENTREKWDPLSICRLEMLVWVHLLSHSFLTPPSSGLPSYTPGTPDVRTDVNVPWHTCLPKHLSCLNLSLIRTRDYVMKG